MANNVASFYFFYGHEEQKIQGERSSNEPTLRRAKLNFFCQDIQVLKQLGGFMAD